MLFVRSGTVVQVWTGGAEGEVAVEVVVKSRFSSETGSRGTSWHHGEATETVMTIAVERSRYLPKARVSGQESGVSGARSEVAVEMQLHSESAI
jgi:hypothetical protein